jgi:DivIVA domain-containing protein
MTSNENGSGPGERRLTASDVHHVRFTRASVLHPGYMHTEVDRFLNRIAEEMARLTTEKAELRDRVRALEDQLEGVANTEAPSDQAVRILASAQLTADNYVAEAEEFSRQMTSEARAQYEDQLREARESAGAMIQAAQEAASRMTGGERAAARPVDATTEELEEQVAYLKAFAQACRVQLRSYLEALLGDVESEWGRANPAALPQAPLRMPAQRSDSGATARFFSNMAADDDAEGGVPATAGSQSGS